MHRADTFQQEAIDSTDRGIRIVAPAGSGKTETIARRVARNIEQGMDRDRILVLTFDNNAKKSLESFLKDAVPRKQMPTVRNFNQHGLFILKKWFPDEHAQLITHEDGEKLKRHFRQYEPDLPVLEWDGVRRSLVDVFEAIKDQGYAPGSTRDIDKQTQWLRTEYLRLPAAGESASIGDFYRLDDQTTQTDAYAPQIAAIIDHYAEHGRMCRPLGIMTYSDQKSRAFHRLWRDSHARAEVKGLYDEVIVDECQDINRLDALLIYATALDARSLVLTGDDDQTLYEFRNAHSLYLREPDRYFPDREFRTIHLNINYRSPSAILNPASRLIAHNVERIEKSPTSGVLETGEVTVLAADSDEKQARHIVEMIRQRMDTRNARWSDIAILCHSDRVEKDMRRILENARIPIYNTDRRRREPVEENGVEILTLFKSKGRQWPMVILPSFEDRTLPDEFSVRKGEIESIRRRVYVAMTRASKHLAVTYIRAGEHDLLHRTSDGDVVSTNGASRFLFEAGLVEDATDRLAPQADDASAEPAVTLAPEPAKWMAIQPEQTDNVEATPKPTVATPQPDTLSHATQPPAVPKVRKGKLQPWNLRQGEIRNLSRGRSMWDTEDYEYAVTCSWKAIEVVLKRLFGAYTHLPQPTVKEVLDTAQAKQTINPIWMSRVHDWRKLRNEVIHETHNVFAGNAERLRTGHQLVEMAPDFLAYIAARVAPKQVALETHDDFIDRLTNVVRMIRQGRSLPKTGRPLKSMRFNPERETLEILTMQFMMVLQDVRFYIPEPYRWNSSRLLTKFVVDELGWVPKGMGGRATNRCIAKTEEDERQLRDRLRMVLRQEAGDQPAARFLQDRIDDALQLRNGNFHAGIKINPREVG